MFAYSNYQFNHPQFTTNAMIQIATKVNSPPLENKTMFDEFVRYLASSAPINTKINLHSVASNYRIEKRRLYNLFNFMVALHICKKDTDNSYIWLGISQLHDWLSKCYSYTETEISKNSFISFFNIGRSPSIGTIAQKLISLFLYLGKSELNVKDISKLFSPNKEQNRQLLRRLYLAAFLFEKFNILVHSTNTGCYSLVPNVTKMKLKVLENLKEQGVFGVNSFASTLSHLDVTFLKAISIDRIEAYEMIVHGEMDSSKNQ